MATLIDTAELDNVVPKARPNGAYEHASVG